MLKAITTTTLLLILSQGSGSSYAKDVVFDYCDSAKRINCVVDGDTMWLHGEKLRLKDYDTPEPTTRICGGEKEKSLARKASGRLIELLNTKSWTIKRFGKDKYGRTLSSISVEGVSVGDILIQEGLARSYPNGHEFWCD